MNKYLSYPLLFALMPIAATAVTLDDLDFSRVLQDAEQQIVFAPLRGTTSNSGVFWYRDLQQRVLSPVKVTNLQRKITLRAYPASHDNGQYQAFVAAHKLLDSRVNLLPANAVLCEGNSALKNKLAQLNLTYSLKPTTGSYPGLCWLEIRYNATSATAAETELLSFLQQQPAMKISYKITTAPTPAIYMDVPALVSRLQQAQLLELKQPVAVDENTPPAEPYHEGALYPVLFAAGQAPADLYRSDLSPQAPLQYLDWYKFISLFHLTTEQKVQLPQSKSGQKLELVAEIPGGTVIEVNKGEQP